MSKHGPCKNVTGMQCGITYEYACKNEVIVEQNCMKIGFTYTHTIDHGIRYGLRAIDTYVRIFQNFQFSWIHNCFNQKFLPTFMW